MNNNVGNQLMYEKEKKNIINLTLSYRILLHRVSYIKELKYDGKTYTNISNITYNPQSSSYNLIVNKQNNVVIANSNKPFKPVVLRDYTGPLRFTTVIKKHSIEHTDPNTGIIRKNIPRNLIHEFTWNYSMSNDVPDTKRSIKFYVPIIVDYYYWGYLDNTFRSLILPEYNHINTIKEYVHQYNIDNNKPDPLKASLELFHKHQKSNTEVNTYEFIKWMNDIVTKDRGINLGKTYESVYNSISKNDYDLDKEFMEALKTNRWYGSESLFESVIGTKLREIGNILFVVEK
jgi:hypothetical protein